MRLSEAFELYRRDVIAFRNMSHKTEENNIYAEKSFIRILGDLDVSELTFMHVRDWSNRCPKKTGHNTKRGYITQLRSVLKFLQYRGIDCVNWESIPVPKRENKEMRLLTDEDIMHIIEACDAGHAFMRLRPRNKLIFSILAGSGLRVSELVSLNRDSINDRQFTIFGKGAKMRPGFIDERTEVLLKAWLESRTDNNPALLVSAYGKRMTASEVRDVCRTVGPRAGVENLHPHDFRHYYGSKMAETGVHIFHMQRFMGHSSMATTQIYLHVRDKQLFDVYNKHSSKVQKSRSKKALQY